MRLVYVRESDLDHTGDAMTSAILSDGQPISEDEFLAIGETPDRIELFDGSLVMTPAPTTIHQQIVGELYAALRTPARRAGVRALPGANVRLSPSRILIPDFLITTEMTNSLIINAGAVVLICEVVSPSNATTDRLTKKHYYATAGIPWYLLIEQDTGTLHLHRLAGDAYTEHSVTKPGDVLHLTEPVIADIDPEELLSPR